MCVDGKQRQPSAIIRASSQCCLVRCSPQDNITAVSTTALQDPSLPTIPDFTSFWRASSTLSPQKHVDRAEFWQQQRFSSTAASSPCPTKHGWSAH